MIPQHVEPLHGPCSACSTSLFMHWRSVARAANTSTTMWALVMTNHARSIAHRRHSKPARTSRPRGPAACAAAPSGSCDTGRVLAERETRSHGQPNHRPVKTSLCRADSVSCSHIAHIIQQRHPDDEIAACWCYQQTGPSTRNATARHSIVKLRAALPAGACVRGRDADAKPRTGRSARHVKNIGMQTATTTQKSHK